jgi:hypothetical protein
MLTYKYISNILSTQLYITGSYTRSCKTVASENTYKSGAPDSGGQYKRKEKKERKLDYFISLYVSME